MHLHSKRSLTHKGQIATEFIFLFIIILFMVFLSITFFEGRRHQLEKLNEKYEAESYLFTYTQAVQTASVLGDGGSVLVTTPYPLTTGSWYTISFYPTERLAKITWDEGQSLVPLPTNQITSITFSGGTHLVKNKGGMITFEYP